MANISPKFFAKLLMVFQYSFQTIERIIERNHVPRFYMEISFNFCLYLQN